jgi:hypothetical protein
MILFTAMRFKERLDAPAEGLQPAADPHL